MEHSEKPDGSQGLDDLPESTSKFWDGEVNRIELAEEKVKFADQPHFFIRVRGHQGYCEHCNYGFELDPGDRIENGHLYDNEGKKII